MRDGLARALIVTALVVGGSGTARAQAPSSNEAAAEALFGEARALIEAGRVAEGCKKLEASQALDPGTGTLIHLADCYEKIGRTASAWARFREAASRAARDNRTDWETIAKTRSAELEPKLARLKVDAPAGVTVRRGDDEVPSAALGSPLPVDPGEYVLVASAPKKKSWTTRVTATAAATTTVSVPALEDDPNAASEPGAEAKKESGSPLRTLGYTAGGVGIVGIVIGAVSGLRAVSLNNRSKDVCPNDGVCADPAARSDNDSARSAATVSTVGFVVGGVLLATGFTLVVLAPSASSAAPAPRAAAPRPTAALRASGGAMWLEGTW